MTLILALKTDTEVDLASDSRSHFKMSDSREGLRTVQKFVKVNDHVEVLISGIFDLALGFHEKVKRNLWKAGLDEECYDAFEIADEIEKVVNPSFEDIISMLSKPSVKSALMNEDKRILAFLKEEWSLEMVVGGMDKDKNGDFVYPMIYNLVPDLYYKKAKSVVPITLGGAPNVKCIAESLLEDLLFADALDSSIDYGNRIYSCFIETIHAIEQQMAENESPTVGEPIHIARITKEGYETLR
jgi:hypothetical protein